MLAHDLEMSGAKFYGNRRKACAPYNCVIDFGGLKALRHTLSLGLSVLITISTASIIRSNSVFDPL